MTDLTAIASSGVTRISRRMTSVVMIAAWPAGTIGCDMIEPNAPVLSMVIVAAAHLVERQLAGAGALAERNELPRKAGDRFVAGIAHDGHDEPRLRRDGDAHVERPAA